MNNGDGEVEVGDRVKVKFKDGIWYKRNVSSLEKGKGREVVKVCLLMMTSMKRKVIGRIRI